MIPLERVSRDFSVSGGLHDVEWYREQRQQIEKLWRKHIDVLLDTLDKPEATKDRLREFQERVTVHD